MVPGMKALLDELHQEITNLERTVQPTWEGLVQPLERIVDRWVASGGWNPISNCWGGHPFHSGCLRMSVFPCITAAQTPEDLGHCVSPQRCQGFRGAAQGRLVPAAARQ